MRITAEADAYLERYGAETVQIDSGIQYVFPGRYQRPEIHIRFGVDVTVYHI